jgi:hypothetical protein
MKKIQKIEKIINIYKYWKPSDIAFIKALKLSVNSLEIIFYSQSRNTDKWPDMAKSFFEISIVFKNVINLKLDFKGEGLHQISGFDILDISDNGLEKVNFQIEDYENGSINFNCEEVEVNNVLTPIKIIVY